MLKNEGIEVFELNDKVVVLKDGRKGIIIDKKLNALSNLPDDHVKIKFKYKVSKKHRDYVDLQDTYYTQVLHISKIKNLSKIFLPMDRMSFIDPVFSTQDNERMIFNQVQSYKKHNNQEKPTIMQADGLKMASQLSITNIKNQGYTTFSDSKVKAIAELKLKYNSIDGVRINLSEEQIKWLIDKLMSCLNEDTLRHDTIASL